MSFADLMSGRPMVGRRDLINGKQDPAQAVAAGVFQINTAVSTFQRHVNALGTAKDTPISVRSCEQKTRLHIGQLVKDTSVKLKQASETDHQAEATVSKKIADAKLAKDFEAVLKEFQKAQRLAAEKETLYTTFVSNKILSPSYPASEDDILFEKSQEQRSLHESRRQEVLLLDNEIILNDAIIEEREQGIKEVQQQIGDVNEIFRDLAVLVHDQGIIIDDIESNIGNTHAATIQAKSHLAQASKSQRTSSSLTCMLMMIFSIVLLIVIIVISA
ncbi:unnamed protein product [Spirodela intermedia]|uniref:t-SNARE coiled-coil homology domain-containing protein n=1 Tax=Spirodela intermedia TaxID=51605 RepID=A0A7I8JSD2_SPIIN|nr:unnamed protein product [Spirodela intermedia]CAA6673117.1 unnamed protein product [Spirodela intermedia]